mgnify:CR=1 FL=1
MILCFLRIHLGRGRHFAASHQCIELLLRKFLSLPISHAIHNITEIYASKIMFFQIFCGQICCTVCNDFKH